jgi:hypothetical protein
MISKSKIALIAALTVSVASPAFAQSFNTEDGSGNELPFAYGPGATKSAWTAEARQNEQLAAQQIGSQRVAVRQNSRGHVAVNPTGGLYAYAAVPGPAPAERNADSPALTGGGSTGYNQMVLTY